MIEIKIHGLENAIGRINRISRGLFGTLMDGIFEAAVYLKDECQIANPEFEYVAIRDESLPGAIVMVSPEYIHKEYIREVGIARVSYMAGRCPKELYFESVLKKYVKPSPIYEKVVKINKEIITNIIREHLIKLFGG